MTNRRVPLASIPNAVNSPSRVAPLAGTKRARPLVADLRQAPYAQQPPAKKLQLEADEAEARRYALLKRTPHASGNLLKKFEASRETRPVTQQKVTSREIKTDQTNLENVRQWQRHYRKAFPHFKFYFESIPADLRSKLSAQVSALGAGEAGFFGNDVTHIVTTRPIPQDDSSSSAYATSPTKKAVPAASSARTINPMLLETQQARGRLAALDPMLLQRKGQPPVEESLLRKPAANTNDVLHKAKDLGIKIWNLEKMLRIMDTMFNTATGAEATLGPDRRNGTTRANRDAELHKLLQQEKMHGNVDREWMMDMVPFKGYYIYVHDMDEKTRPVMMRDYPTVAHKTQGKWPQLRITDPGRCPFLDEPARKHTAASHQQQPKQAAPRTRAASAALKDDVGVKQGVLTENNNLAHRRERSVSVKTPDEEFSKPLDPPKAVHVKRGSTDTLPMFGSAQANLRQMPRYAGGEPVASGVQPSNVTSAIRSQAISSTAPQPGQKAGVSKELNLLKRKVLERNNSYGQTQSTTSTMPSSHLNEVRNAITAAGERPSAMARVNKRKADALVGIEEDAVLMTEEDHHQQQQRPRKLPMLQKKVVKRDPKPGYCENCRIKFDDFEQHIESRVHRKFATSNDNWRELDELLGQLVRPLKRE